MAFPKNPPAYRTVLLIMWEERNRDPDSKAVWRFRLEDPSTGGQHGFASLEEMVAFLRSKLVSSDDQQAD